VAEHGSILKNNQNKHYPSFSFAPKTVKNSPKPACSVFNEKISGPALRLIQIHALELSMLSVMCYTIEYDEQDNVNEGGLLHSTLHALHLFNFTGVKHLITLIELTVNNLVVYRPIPCCTIALLSLATDGKDRMYVRNGFCEIYRVGMATYF